MKPVSFSDATSGGIYVRARKYSFSK